MADVSVLDSLAEMRQFYRSSTGQEPGGAKMGDAMLDRLADETFGTPLAPMTEMRGAALVPMTREQWREHVKAAAERG